MKPNERKMRGLDLFSGIGGLSDALHPWVRPVVYCERELHSQGVLLSRMYDRSLPRGPIWDDVQTLHGGMLPPIDIIFGGFPCQDISSAGRGAGLEGERSGLFFEISRLTSELRPQFVFLENVPIITARGLDRVAGEFSGLGYDCRWAIVSAAEVGARHRRKRWFLLANSRGESVRLPESGQRRKEIHAPGTLEAGQNTHSNGFGLQAVGPSIGLQTPKPFTTDLLEGNNWNDYAAFFSRMDHGLSHRGHRIKALGNAVVPQQAREAFQRLIGGLR